MALPASGAISIGNVQTEFGGTNPAGMSEYYSGGAYVPAGTTGGNGSDGVSAGTVIPTSGTIKLANFYNATTAPASMTIGAKTVTYTAGKTFEYYDSVVTSPGSDVNITVTQDRACTVTLCAAGGESAPAGSGANGGSGGGSQALTFTFTFKAGITYVLRLGTVRGGGAPSSGTVAGYGGGFSALYLGSVSTSNIIAIVGAGGGAGVFSTGTYSSGSGGHSGSTGPTAVTNGVAWTGSTASGALTANRGGGAAINAGGAAGTGSQNGTAGGAYTAGTGSAYSSGYAGGGGGNGFYGGGGGGSSFGSSSAGGGGGGASFLYTANDGSGKTAVYSSSVNGSTGTALTANTGRPGFVGRAGTAGNSSATTAALLWWSSFGNWRAPYPGGSAAGGVTYSCVLGADVASGATSLTLAYLITTSASSLSSSSTLTFGADCRRLTTGPNVLEFTISGTTYTKVVSSVSTVAINLTTTLGVAVPAGQQIYIYPVKSTVATTIGAINVAAAFPTSSNSLWRVVEPSGTYVYGFFPAAASWTGGGTTPLTVTLQAAIYPTATLPKGSVVQRSAATNTDGATSYTAAQLMGACPGAIRITMT